MQWILTAFVLCFVPPGESAQECNRYSWKTVPSAKQPERFDTLDECRQAAKRWAGVAMISNGLPDTFFTGAAECERVAKELEA